MTRPAPLLLAGVCLLAALVYANTLANGFALDDQFIIEDNPDVHGLAVLPDAVTGPYWPDATAELAMYRPVPLASFAVDWSIWAGRPAGFHFTNILLHVAVTALVFLLLTSLGAGPLGAVGGAALFAVHPVHVEAVANVVGRAELQATLFFLAACLAYLRMRVGWHQAAIVAALYLGALLSKEIGVTLPGALALLHVARGASPSGALAELRPRWRVYAALAIALVVYLALRWVNIGAVLGAGTAPWFWNRPESVRIWSAIRVFPEYLRLMVAPAELVADYGPAVILPEGSWSSPRVVAGFLLAALAGIAAVAAWKRMRLASVGILWFAGTVLPVSGLLFSTDFLLAERVLYLPSVAVALVAAGLLGALRRGVAREAATVALAALVVAGGVRTWTHNPVWRSTDTVLDHLVRTHPENFRSRWLQATWLQQDGRHDDALDHLALALRLAPGHFNIRRHYGDLLEQRGDLRAAAAQYDTARAIRPGNSLATIRYLQILLRAEEFTRAATEGTALLPTFPSSPVIHHLVAQALTRLGRWDDARRIRVGLLTVDKPENRWAHWVNIAALDLAARDSAAAGAALDSAHAHVTPGAVVPDFRTLRAALAASDGRVIPFW